MTENNPEKPKIKKTISEWVVFQRHENGQFTLVSPNVFETNLQNNCDIEIKEGKTIFKYKEV